MNISVFDSEASSAVYLDGILDVVFYGADHQQDAEAYTQAKHCPDTKDFNLLVKEMRYRALQAGKPYAELEQLLDHMAALARAYLLEHPSEGAVRMPAELFPVGTHINEELEARGWTQTTLAAESELDAETIANVISGAAEVDQRIAEGIGDAFGTSATLWLNLDAGYRMWAKATGAMS